MKLKKNIILGVVLIVILIIAVLIKNSGSYIEGTVIDITLQNNNKSSVLLNIKETPYTVYFENIDISTIELNDLLKIKTTGIERESYPIQVDGLSFKKKENKSIKVKGKYDPSEQNNIQTIVFSNYFQEEESNYMSRFKTKKITNATEFNEFITSKQIVIPKELNINDLFLNNFVIISYTNMSNSGILDFDGLYKQDNNIYIHIDIKGNEDTNDTTTRGVISFIPREYENFIPKTLSKQKNN